VVEVAAPEAGKEGYVLRMLPPDSSLDPTAGIASLAVHLLATHTSDGLRLTRDAVLARDMLLLHGPWMTGDRFSVFGFGLFALLVVNEYLVGVMHFHVESATPTSVRLTCDFWAGKQKPALFGHGELTLESDAEGLKRVYSSWERTHGPEWREATVTVTRLAIRGLGEDGSDSGVTEDNRRN
jgi:hypothetical protein